MNNKDIPLQRQMIIGKASVGLIGVDSALSHVLNRQDMTLDEAVDFLFEKVAAVNYVPRGKEMLYREALASEYVRLKRGDKAEASALVVRILGPGCVSCNNIQLMVVEIMDKLGIAADIFQVHDLDEIGRYGVTQTPALLINGEIKSSGRLPSSSQIEEWLREAIG